MRTWVAEVAILPYRHHLAVKLGGLEIHAAIVQNSDPELAENTAGALNVKPQLTDGSRICIGQKLIEDSQKEYRQKAARYIVYNKMLCSYLCAVLLRVSSGYLDDTEKDRQRQGGT